MNSKLNWINNEQFKNSEYKYAIVGKYWTSSSYILLFDKNVNILTSIIYNKILLKLIQLIQSIYLNKNI